MTNDELRAQLKGGIDYEVAVHRAVLEDCYFIEFKNRSAPLLKETLETSHGHTRMFKRFRAVLTVLDKHKVKDFRVHLA